MSIKNGDLPEMSVKHDGACSAGDGFSKREELSARFMAAILSSPNLNGELSDSQLASIACAQADALLAELEKSK